MDVLVGFLILGALFGIFVAIQKLNSNIITQIDQNEKIIELMKERMHREIRDGNNHNIQD
ncbi:hypothetical protein [Paenibacillus aceris]|uniref:Uncharacterized protein YneF (UPF0154 family) n=1 Tax=Paenibacillus aceris TaxID=869555 RepID=A0ABS4HYE1_9BACL|nr:hypothetical protein [Paenibacillus aceris]MBP1963356.1 uncharacterized protein YneF (UPF0154 family) [Paenibacillus aceris]NHW36137.1 hypothetical protein [Paenibacillus aceris]